MSTMPDLAGQSLSQARRQLTEKLSAAAIDSPALDARLLLGAALGLDLTGMIAATERILTAKEAGIIAMLAQRRLAGEPVARILGVKEFWGLALDVAPATLVPRPDTETLVETALDLLRNDARAGQHLRIADIGTGSGAILLALLSELPNAIGVGTDLNVDAAMTARRNAQRLGLAARASFIVCDYTNALHAPFDLIVSNPPYIPSRQIETLAIEVRDHDPHLALDGGADGLAAYRAIAPAAYELLTPGGAVLFEVGQGQSNDVMRIMAASGFTSAGAPRADLAGIERVVTGRKMAFYKGSEPKKPLGL